MGKASGEPLIVTETKLRHDVEQLEYLSTRQLLSESGHAILSPIGRR